MTSHDVESAETIATHLEDVLDELRSAMDQASDLDPQEWHGAYLDLLDSLGTIIGLTKTAELEARLASKTFTVAMSRAWLDSKVKSQ